jgi:oligopeptide transport system permease protein
LSGIGQHFVNGAFNRDYTLVMGVTILYGLLIVFTTSAGGRLRAARSAREAAMNRSLPRYSIAIVVALVLTALLVPWISRTTTTRPDWDQTDLAPAWAHGHLLGTDSLGRDLLVRLMWSTRISLLVALAASLISLTIGVAWGVTAGYLGGRTDTVMMRLVDVLYSVPFTPFVIVLTVLFGRNLLLLFVAIGAVSG